MSSPPTPCSWSSPSACCVLSSCASTAANSTASRATRRMCCSRSAQRKATTSSRVDPSIVLTSTPTPHSYQMRAIVDEQDAKIQQMSDALRELEVMALAARRRTSRKPLHSHSRSPAPPSFIVTRGNDRGNTAADGEHARGRRATRGHRSVASRQERSVALPDATKRACCGGGALSRGGGARSRVEARRRRR